MDSFKSLRPNGFHACFYKYTWARSGPALISFALNTLAGNVLDQESAEALLVLIPKEEKSSFVRNFRPISLCNVSLKLATKKITNRVKGVLSDVIAPNEVSVVLGWQSIKNVIIC